MAQYVGWRNYSWLNVGLLGLLLILIVFFFPETKWHRVHPSEIHGSISTAGNGIQAPEKTESECEKPEISSQPALTTVETASDPWLHKGYPSKKQFQLWQLDGHTLKSLFITFWTPWELLLFPIIELAAFVVSWSASCFLTVNLTQSQAFAAPPYNFSSQTIGFFNFALLIGSFLGLATNGPLSDWVSMRATRKNGGVREPEMRLPALIPYVIISMIGNFIIAFGYQYHWDWRVGQEAPCTTSHQLSRKHSPLTCCQLSF